MLGRGSPRQAHIANRSTAGRFTHYLLTSRYTSQRYLFEDRVPWRAEVMAACAIDAIPRALQLFGGVYRGQSEKAVALHTVARTAVSFYTRSSLVVG